ncbi:hypothetical protein [Limnohabitans sp.]|uniref:hypothetical protein n=1 Tax=Limnohabitans sp. TaxID=1907725 RepID=UPI00286F1D8C|nr:hypothetical protein [Limnohabitans sp.]
MSTQRKSTNQDPILILSLSDPALRNAMGADARAANVMDSIKELVNDASTQSRTHQLAQERNHFVKNLHHPNAGAGIQAFLSKDYPIYK